MEALLTIPETAELLRLSESRVKQLIAAGEIRHAKLGKAVRVDPIDLRKYIDSRKAPVPEFVPTSSIQGESDIANTNRQVTVATRY